MSEPKDTAVTRDDSGVGTPGDATARRSKFGTASEGWDAYNSWLSRVRQQAAPNSRQAVIAKALSRVSSYKSWAAKARGAFDEEK